MALATLVGAATVNAQNTTEKVSARKAHFAKDGAGSHWFLELGDAASYHFSGMNYKDRPSRKDGINLVNPQIGIGRWFNPYFAVRVQATYLNMNDGYQFANSTAWNESTHKYLAGQVQFMFDVSNFVTPYRENRFFHFIPFVGIGAATHLSADYDNLAPVTKAGKYTALAAGGLQLKFRLSKRVDLNLEGQVIAKNTRVASELRPLVHPSIPGSPSASNLAFKQSFLGTLGASLTFHLGKKEFTPVKQQDDALLASLNDQLNALRAENDELRKRPVDCPEPIATAPVVQGVTVGNVIYFRINSSTVDPNQLINLRNIAEYAKNNTETITLVGYADRQTGTPEYNYALSERRAEAVKKILVNKYGISADRIKTSWEGDRVQPYAENVWNRIVIMNAE